MDPYRVNTPIPGIGQTFRVESTYGVKPDPPPQSSPPCDYCPPDHRRLAYRMLEAVDTDPWGRRTFHIQRFICAACEIRTWDIVLRPRVDAAAPSASAPAGPLEQRVRDLEDMVADLQEQLKHLASQPAGGDRR